MFFFLVELSNAQRLDLFVSYLVPPITDPPPVIESALKPAEAEPEMVAHLGGAVLGFS
jgi:hypothetical protein